MIQLNNKNLFIEKAFIDGLWVKGEHTLKVVNPANHEVLGTIPNLGVQETQAAIDAAALAFSSWSLLAGKKRSQLLAAWFQAILAARDDLAKLMTLESGKPLAESYIEVDYGASFVEWFAEEAKRINGDILPAPTTEQQVLTYRMPVGVVGAITPWNFPLGMITRKCAPALAAGCTIVLKPSELTPFTALALAKLAEEVGIPKGVINIVTGEAQAIGKALIDDFRVRKISFTGSTHVGQYLMRESAGTLKKLSLELGGNAPFIVFEDADIEQVLTSILRGKIRNSGQTCVCPNRFLIAEKIWPKLQAKLQELVKNLKVGMGLDEGVQVGPLINQAGFDKVKSLLAEAVAAGAKVLQGGQPHALGYTFFEPTLLCEVKPDMRIFNEEIFGPVLSVMTFKTEEEAIRLANDTIYGLAAYVFTQDYRRILRLGQQLHFGMVGVNTCAISSEFLPFGGVKASGFGREGSHYGIEEFLELRSVCVNL